MKLVKFKAEDSSKLFGSYIINNEVQSEFTPKNIIPIAHTQDASEYIGISFEDTTPLECTEITEIEADKYYFFFSPIHGYWLTLDLVDIALKILRDKELEGLTVTLNEQVFNADEKSQDRISRAISALNDQETTYWKTFHNIFVSVSKEDFKSILRLAGSAQTELWIKYSL
jgi:hypothetical protein